MRYDIPRILTFRWLSKFLFLKLIINTMDKIAISVIIPIYNASKYLKRCLQSVIDQTFKDFELILVDDGSKDNSLEICKIFKEKDPRISIISQPNSGSSVARNVGLDSSSGEYVLQIDADDWIEPNMLEVMYREAINTGADIIGTGFYKEYPSGKSEKFVYPYLNEDNQIPLRIQVLYCAFWNKLIKRQLYLDFDIRGVPGITMWEDNIVTLRLRYHSKKTVCLDQALYHYRVETGNSMCDQNRDKYPDSKIKAAVYLSKYFNRIATNDKLAQYCVSNLKIVAKNSIWRNKNIGGVTIWKEVLPVSYSDIWISQLKNSEKIILTMLQFLPPSIGQLIVYVTFFCWQALKSFIRCR